MKLKKWALVAEIFSAFAVFVTLVILLFEVRAGNELTRIASFQDILTALNQQRTLAISDPEISALLLEARSRRYPELGTPEGDKLRMFLTNESRSRGHVTWREFTRHASENIGTTDVHAIAIELK